MATIAAMSALTRSSSFTSARSAARSRLSAANYNGNHQGINFAGRECPLSGASRTQLGHGPMSQIAISGLRPTNEASVVGHLWNAIDGQRRRRKGHPESGLSSAIIGVAGRPPHHPPLASASTASLSRRGGRAPPPPPPPPERA